MWCSDQNVLFLMCRFLGVLHFCFQWIQGCTIYPWWIQWECRHVVFWLVFAYRPRLLFFSDNKYMYSSRLKRPKKRFNSISRCPAVSISTGTFDMHVLAPLRHYIYDSSLDPITLVIRVGLSTECDLYTKTPKPTGAPAQTRTQLYFLWVQIRAST